MCKCFSENKVTKQESYKIEQNNTVILTISTHKHQHGEIMYYYGWTSLY